MLLVELVVRQGEELTHHLLLVADGDVALRPDAEELTHHLLLVADGDVALRPDAGQLKRILVTELAGGL